jgi:chromosome segregation ATPase
MIQYLMFNVGIRFKNEVTKKRNEELARKAETIKEQASAEDELLKSAVKQSSLESDAILKMERKKKHLDEIRESLKAPLREKKHEAEEKKKQLDEIRESLNGALKEKKDAEEEQTEMVRLIYESDHLQRTMAKQVASYNPKVAPLTEERDSLSTQLAEAKKTGDESKIEEITILLGKNHEKIAIMSKLGAELKKTESRIYEIYAMQPMVALIKAKLAKATEKVTDLEDKLAKATEEFTDLEDKLAKATEKVAGLEKNLRICHNPDCFNPGTVRCSRCKMVFYCGKMLFRIRLRVQSKTVA